MQESFQHKVKPSEITASKLTFTPGKLESLRIALTFSAPPEDCAAPFNAYEVRSAAKVTRPPLHIRTPSATVNGHSPGHVASDTKPAGLLGGGFVAGAFGAGAGAKGVVVNGCVGGVRVVLAGPVVDGRALGLGGASLPHAVVDATTAVMRIAARRGRIWNAYQSGAGVGQEVIRLNVPTTPHPGIPNPPSQPPPWGRRFLVCTGLGLFLCRAVWVWVPVFSASCVLVWGQEWRVLVRLSSRCC